MLSLCHIFSDAKFVDLIFAYFNSDLFVNEGIFIGDGKAYKGIHKDSIEFIDYGESGIARIIKICCKHDVIIFHNLDYYKSIIANRLPKGMKMVWRFFGTEFYSIPEYQLNYYSDRTKDALNINYYYHLRVHIFNFIRIFKYAFQLKRTPIAEFNRAINKISYVLAWDKDEYFHIKKHWKTFPKLIELSALSKIEKRSSLNNKNNNIVIGNSRAPENNHLDIIDLFENCPTKGSFSLVLPLSYGDKGSYYRRLINRIKLSKIEIQLLCEFLPFDIYAEKVVNAKAAVINTYRQMALGNCFLFLGNDVKLYLSEKNPSYNYLRRLGFFISSVETNLKNDIIDEDLTLKPYQAEINRNIMDNLSDNHNVVAFQDNFYRLFR